MKIQIILTLFFLSTLSFAQSDDPTEVSSGVGAEDTVHFDAQLADKLNADEYGMSQYIFAFLKRGPNRDRDSLEAVQLQRAHLANIQRLAEEGKLVLAGPFMDNGEIRGIYIFNVQTIEEAQQLVNTDPAIQAGSLEMELRPWYGAAALKLLKDLYLKLARKKF